MIIDTSPAIDCVEYTAAFLHDRPDDFALWLEQIERKWPKVTNPETGDVVLYLNPNDGLADHIGIYVGKGNVKSMIGGGGEVLTLPLRHHRLVSNYGDKIEFRRKPG